MLNQPALIFMHISKTGGSTLRSIIQRQFAKDSIYDLDPSYFASDAKDYDKVMQERFAQLKALDDSEKTKLRCILHPGNYGLHEFLPQESVYLTFLREPIDHFISSYYFAVNKSGHIHHQLIKSENLSIEAFIDRLPVDNMQTRRLSACDPVERLSRASGIKDAVDEADLEKAKEHLAQMPIFGLLEAYDESMLLIQEKFAWKDVSYVAQNVAPKRLKLKDASAELQEKLSKYLAFDIELHRFAESLFQERRAASKLDLDAALKTYQEKNQALARRQNLNKKMRSLVKSIIPSAIRKK